MSSCLSRGRKEEQDGGMLCSPDGSTRLSSPLSRHWPLRRQAPQRSLLERKKAEAEKGTGWFLEVVKPSLCSVQAGIRLQFSSNRSSRSTASLRLRVATLRTGAPFGMGTAPFTTFQSFKSLETGRFNSPKLALSLANGLKVRSSRKHKLGGILPRFGNS